MGLGVGQYQFGARTGGCAFRSEGDKVEWNVSFQGEAFGRKEWTGEFCFL